MRLDIANKAERFLSVLDEAVPLKDLDLPGYSLHALTGDKRGFYSVAEPRNHELYSGAKTLRIMDWDFRTTDEVKVILDARPDKMYHKRYNSFKGVFRMRKNLKKLIAGFYRTKTGNEPIRDWLKKLSDTDRKLLDRILPLLNIRGLSVCLYAVRLKKVAFGKSEVIWTKN